MLLALTIAIPTAGPASAGSFEFDPVRHDPAPGDSWTASVSGTVSLPGLPDELREGIGVRLHKWWSYGIGTVPVVDEKFTGGLSFLAAGTDESGNFSIDGIPAGTYTLKFDNGPWDFETSAPKYAGTYLGGGASAMTAVYFTIGEGEHLGGKGTALAPPGFIDTTMRDNSGSPLAGTVGIWQGGTADNAASLVKSVPAGQRTYVPRGGGYRLGYACGSDATNNDGSLRSSPPPCMSQWWGGSYTYSDAPLFGIGDTSVPPFEGTMQDDPWWPQYGSTYVALGDSYQSGEGAYNYFEGTDSTYNKCHRSTEAYPARLASDQLQMLTLDFQACSGAVMVNLFQPEGADGVPWDEGEAQLDALGGDTRLVTIGIVGNDLGFAKTVEECIKSTLLSRVTEEFGFVISCEALQGAGAAESVASLESGVFRQQLLTVYRAVRAKAPNARVVVVTYPSFFPQEGTEPGLCGWTIRNSDQRWMNLMIRRADTAISRHAKSMGFEVVNMVDAFRGHEQCTDNAAMHHILADNTTFPPVASESFHPNEYGHRIMADLIAAQLVEKYSPDFTIRPAEMVTRSITVTGPALSVTTGWPGSDVVTSLVSPSGAVYTRETPGVAEHDFGPTWEYYRIENPEPGEWTVNVFGADVAVGGEMVQLAMVDEAPFNVMPSAEFTASGVGDTFTFDASASVDSDGSIVDYVWDFGDGTSAQGAVVEHTYEIPGRYSVVVTTTDNEGGQGFGSDEQIYEIEEPNPEPVPGPAVYSATSMTVTNQFGTTGEAADVYVEGDYTCNSSVSIAGSVYATGNANLTNTCRITGDLLVGGNVKMNSSARVDGSVLAHGNVSIQSSNRIGGDVRAGGTFSTIDGKTNAYLLSHGVIGGVIETQAIVPDLPASPAPVFEFAPEDWDGYTTVNWKSWMNATAIANNAPSWSQGRTANPGCVMAPWGSSVNGSTVTVVGDTVIDARQASSGCTGVTLQSMTLRVSGDVVLIANSFSGINGLRIESADGAPHTVRLLVPGEQVACASAHTVSLSAATVVTPDITLRVMTPGKVAMNGTTTLRGSIAAGCVAASGNVKLEYVP